ncbi:alpha/beta fold hydrolase [Streptomyces hainanensis]|uniref:Alpha/beta fold hydrolase n=1 Tax=Streptomyces hainanensis TaxID=402648 RepID=A0A4R4TQD4_9ACTN|nr:alpha/beta fold hydrolase [Streptomyces hainanensis]TDC80180.1 alpha/beta fold hydrolase [Streptomyces hainanensis]
MARKKFGTAAAIALCTALAGVTLVGCSDSDPDAESAPETEATTEAPAGDADEELLTGPRTITVGEYSVNVSCSGTPVDGRPTVVLLHGGGDDLLTMADFQEALSAEGRVCSYDRLGAGGSDQPAGPQDFDDTSEVLDGVLAQVAGDEGAVLAGHSMGGLIAARYAPDHQDRVAGLVLLDATPPTQVGDLTNRIPESATGPAAEVRAQTLAIFEGQNPEQLVFTDGEVRSAGDIPVRVVQHGVQYLGEVPEYGAGLEEDWTAGQEQWLALSSDSELSTAENSGHYIHVEAPDVAADAVNEVAGLATAG